MLALGMGPVAAGHQQQVGGLGHADSVDDGVRGRTAGVQRHHQTGGVDDGFDFGIADGGHHDVDGAVDVDGGAAGY